MNNKVKYRVESSTGYYDIPAKYLLVRPRGMNPEQVINNKNFGFMFWDSDGRPPEQDPFSIATLYSEETKRSEDDFLIKVTAVRSLEDPSDAVIPALTQLAGLLKRRGTANSNFSSSDGCLEISRSFLEGKSEHYFFGNSGAEDEKNNISYWMRYNKAPGLLPYMDGQIDYHSHILSVHLIIPRDHLKRISEIAECIHGLLQIWRDGVHQLAHRP